MALIQCPECGSNVSDKVVSCPHCGYAFQQKVTSTPEAHSTPATPAEPEAPIASVEAPQRSKSKIILMVLGYGCLAAFLIGGIIALVNDGIFSSNDQGHKSSTKGETTVVEEVYAKEEPSTIEEVTGTTERLYPTGAFGSCDHEGNVYYTPSKLIDGNIHTCWAIDLRSKQLYSNRGFGDLRIKVNCKRLDYIVLYNGYQKNNTTYWGNPRAKTIAIYNVDDMSEPILEGQLHDTEQGQKVYATDNSANRNLREVAIYFPGDFYYPAKWNDFSISEIEFFGVR